MARSLLPDSDESKSMESELANLVPDLLACAKKELHQYLFLRLLENFRRVKLTESESLYDLKPNHGAVLLWAEIVEICTLLTDKSLPANPELTSQALIRSLQISHGYFDVESYSLQDVASGLGNSTTEDTLRRVLILYSDIYDGRYKTALSYYHLVMELLFKKRSSIKRFESYFEDDVSFKLQSIKKLGRKESGLGDFELLCLGADSHVRNAVAHKRWTFGEGRVTLFDRDGWEQAFYYKDLELLHKKITLVTNGLEAGEIFAFGAHQREIAKHVGIPTYDLNTIKAFMAEFANIEGFEVVSLNELEEGKLGCTLKEISPGNVFPSMPERPEGESMRKAQREFWIERTTRLINNCLDILRAYKKLTVTLRNQTDHLLITFQVELKKSATPDSR